VDRRRLVPGGGRRRRDGTTEKTRTAFWIFSTSYIFLIRRYFQTKRIYQILCYIRGDKKIQKRKSRNFSIGGEKNIILAT
jgi:hypothetical protein